MKQKKMDLRARQTYMLLTNALFELLREKSFSEISVTDICEKAMVHRTTFYKHFEDKEHLLRAVISDLQNEFQKHCKEELKGEYTHKEYYLYLFKKVLEYISENKILISKTLFDKTNNYIEEVCCTAIATQLKEHFKMREKNHCVKFKIPHSILATYYTSASISLADWWLKNDMSIPIDDMVKYLNTIVSGNIVENI